MEAADLRSSAGPSVAFWSRAGDATFKLDRLEVEYRWEADSEYGGYAAAVVLVAFGIGALVLSINGKSTVKDNLSQEKIVGSADMTPDAIAAEAQKAGLSGVDLPSCSVAGEQVDTGSEARCFANYMRIHALEASGGKTYAEMPRYATADGKGTNDPAQAQKDANGQPVRTLPATCG